MSRGGPLRIAILSNYTLDPLGALLSREVAGQGLSAEVWVAPFGTYAQQILNPASELHGFGPDVTILALSPGTLFGRLLDRFWDLSPESRRAEVSRTVGEIAALIETHARGRGILLVHNFIVPSAPVLGLHDIREPLGERAAIAAANEELAAACRKQSGVFVVDVEALAGLTGKDAWTDPKMFFLARMEVSHAALEQLSKETMRFIRGLAGRVRKVLVLDLDNTLWGGIIGEDGLAGIQLGDAPPGNAFVAFQRRLLALQRRGVLLAVNSANNHDEAIEAMRKHPEMVLKPEHFAAMRINWKEKTENMGELAEELRLGLDSFVFWDDSLIEQERVRALLPEVLTVEVPRDPALYERALSRITEFDALDLTEEDRARGRMMAEGHARREARAKIETEEDFLRSLEIQATVAPPDDVTLPRFAQLTQRTNQFNLTTRRYTEAELSRMTASEGVLARGLRVIDRFGDEGWVGLALIERSGEKARVDTFLMSCRVIGRKIEHAFLAALLRELKTGGVLRLEAAYRRTARNSLCEGFWREAGFERVGEKDDETRYALDLAGMTPSVPGHVSLLRSDPEAAPPRGRA
jgi:FkbH-like protein